MTISVDAVVYYQVNTISVFLSKYSQNIPCYTAKLAFSVTQTRQSPVCSASVVGHSDIIAIISRVWAATQHGRHAIGCLLISTPALYKGIATMLYLLTFEINFYYNFIFDLVDSGIKIWIIQDSFLSTNISSLSSYRHLTFRIIQNCIDEKCSKMFKS